MSTPAPVLSLKGVEKAFGKNKVLHGVDLDVAAGQSLVVIGGSGTGKSVMLKTALGLLTPDAGAVEFQGKSILKSKSGLKTLREETGMLFQSAALFDSLTIWENVVFRQLNSGEMSRKDARDLAIETMKKVRLTDRVADLRPAEISGGMQKRVGLARAIVSKPKLIFFDEPTTGLDPITADAINDLILEQVKGMGAASISITHDMASARKIADEIAMIFRGKIIWRDAASKVDDSGNPYIEQFVKGLAEGPIEPGF